jgi:hypothetical protein
LQGAARWRTLRPLTPHITKSSMALRDVLGLRASRDEAGDAISEADVSL